MSTSISVYINMSENSKMQIGSNLVSSLANSEKAGAQIQKTSRIVYTGAYVENKPTACARKQLLGIGMCILYVVAVIKKIDMKPKRSHYTIQYTLNSKKYQNKYEMQNRIQL